MKIGSNVLFALAVTVTAAVVAHADSRPRTPVPPGTSDNRPNPFAPPAGKGGVWIYTPGAMPGNVGDPWLRNWIVNPLEPGDPVPPGDVGGDGGIGEPCTNC
jgi:hypothetical protein